MPRPRRGEPDEPRGQRDLLASGPAPAPPGREQALQAAIHELVPSWHRDYPDSPDEVITAVRRMPAAEAQFAPVPDGVDPRLVAALAGRGITRLFTHQAAAVAHALAGENVVVTTPTASGKTLCYNVPVLNQVLRDPASRAL